MDLAMELTHVNWTYLEVPIRLRIHAVAAMFHNRFPQVDFLKRFCC